jgi:hypothetical protein
MAMTWLQKMFTPERSGSYQWQGRPDEGGGEFTGEQRDAQGNITYEGDEQYLTFVPRANRGPGNTIGQNLMPQAYTPQDGNGYPTGGGDYDSAGMDNVEDVNIQIEESMTMPSSSMGPTADVGMTNIAETIKALGMGGGRGMQGFKPGGALARMGPNQGGLRTVSGGGALPRPSGGAMAKVNPGTRPHFGFNPSKFNQGSTQKQAPGYLRMLFDYAKLFGRGLGGGAAMMLHSPDVGASSDQPDVSNTGVPAAWNDFSGMAQDYNNWDPMNPTLEIPQMQPTTPMIPNITSGSGARFAEPGGYKPGTVSGLNNMPMGSRRMY